MPINKLKEFIDGYQTGDGFLKEKENNNYKITTVSFNLALGFQNIIHKVYKTPCRINFNKTKDSTIIEGRKVNQRDFYTINFRKTETREKIHIQDGKLWFPLRKEMELVDKKIRVYNLEVEDDHSYTVNNLIVKNCQSYSVASVNAEGLEGGKGVLWWDIYRITKDKNPDFLFLENVDRLLKSPSKQRGKDFAVILSSLNNLGYDVEWMVIDASAYGMPQRRKRTFIFASKKETRTSDLLKGKPEDVLNKKMMFQKAFPKKEIKKENIMSGKLSSDLVKVTKEFNKEFPTKNAFFDVGYMKDGKYYTSKFEPDYNGKRVYLKDILIDEKDVPKEFYVDEENLKKWEYLKGSKSFDRVNKKTGHKYKYSEGKMAFPDYLDRPSRTIITGEGGAAASRTKHIIKVGDKYRRLTPIELERLSMFPDNHTEGVLDTKRAFLIGNALVVGIVERFGKELDKFLNIDKS